MRNTLFLTLLHEQFPSVALPSAFLRSHEWPPQNYWWFYPKGEEPIFHAIILCTELPKVIRAIQLCEQGTVNYATCNLTHVGRYLIPYFVRKRAKELVSVL